MSVLTETTFKRSAVIARRRWGLSLGERKMQLVANRLTSHLRKSGGGEIEDYVSRLERNPTEDDMLVLFDILSTNVTSFFRDPAHFAFLERELYTGLAKGTLALPGKRLRIWSAACSIGAEPYSLAMQALELLPPAAGYDVKILATDLANKALVGCREGIYTESQLSGLSPERRAKFLIKAEPKPGSGEPRWRVKDEVKRLVEVRRQNLVEPYTGLGPFDVIFLRNVMIYFDLESREALVERLTEQLVPGGYLFVGLSENLVGVRHGLKSVWPSVYMRPE